MMVLTDSYPSVYETLMREAMNMNPGDRIITVR